MSQSTQAPSRTLSINIERANLWYTYHKAS